MQIDSFITVKTFSKNVFFYKSLHFLHQPLHYFFVVFMVTSSSIHLLSFLLCPYPGVSFMHSIYFLIPSLKISAFQFLYLVQKYICWRRKWQSTVVFLLGKSHGQRSLAGCSPWGRKKSDATEHAQIHLGLWPLYYYCFFSVSVLLIKQSLFIKQITIVRFI